MSRPFDSLSEPDSQAAFVSAFDLIRDACLFTEEDGTIVCANAAATRMYGYSADELVRMNIASLSTEDGPLVAIPGDPTDANVTYTAHGRHKDGSVFRVEADADSVQLAGRHMTVIVLREVSDQRAATLDAAFKSELLDAALDSILVHTPDGQLLYFNEAAHTKVGLTREEFSALGPYGWTTPESQSRRPRLLEALRTTGHARFETSSIHKDGHRIPAEVHARLVDSPHGAVIVSVVRDISERRQAEEQLRHMAFHDQLTGLANRSLLDEQLSVAMANTQRHGDLVGVAYVDLDDFKQVNDAHGHAYGDQVLMVVADRLRMCVRRSDTVARLGGDEFVVLLPRITRPADLVRAARKIVSTLREPFYVDGRSVTLTTSVGLALYDPQRDDARSLLIRADVAMYAAKRSGANRYQLSEPVHERTDAAETPTLLGT